MLHVTLLVVPGSQYALNNVDDNYHPFLPLPKRNRSRKICYVFLYSVRTDGAHSQEYNFKMKPRFLISIYLFNTLSKHKARVVVMISVIC